MDRRVMRRGRGTAVLEMGQRVMWSYLGFVAILEMRGQKEREKGPRTVGTRHRMARWLELEAAAAAAAAAAVDYQQSREMAIETGFEYFPVFV